MNKFIEKIKSSESIKNVSKITSGTMLGQIISFIVVPIYTRLYGASIMGTWTLFTSIANIIVVFSDLGMKNAIMVEEKDEDTVELYTVITTITLVISLISSLAILGFYTAFPDRGDGLPAWLIALFVLVLAITTQQTQTCYTWLNKKSEYSILMKNPVVNNLSAAIIIIVLGLLGYIRYGYYIGTMLGQIITLVHMRVRLPKQFITFDPKSYIKVFKKQKHFIMYQLPASAVAQIKNQMPTFLIKGFFGSEMLGYYSISLKYLTLPINLLALSIGRVYYQTTSKMRREGESLRSIGLYSLKNITRAMKVAYLPMIGIIGFGDLACVILFGNDFLVAGNIMRIIAFNCFFLFIATATNGLAIVIDKQKYILWCGIIQLIGYLVGIPFGYYVFNSIYVSCLTMTITFILAQVIYFSAMFKFTDVDWKKYVLGVIRSISIILAISFVIRIVLLKFGLVANI